MSDKNKLKLNFTRNNLKLDNSISFNSSSQRRKYESRKLSKIHLIPKVFDMGGAAKKRWERTQKTAIKAYKQRPGSSSGLIYTPTLLATNANGCELVVCTLIEPLPSRNTTLHTQLCIRVCFPPGATHK